MDELRKGASPDTANAIFPRAKDPGILLSRGDAARRDIPGGFELLSPGWSIALRTGPCAGVLLDEREGELFVLPFNDKLRRLEGGGRAWLLPLEPEAAEAALSIEAPGAAISVRRLGPGWEIRIAAKSCRVTPHPARPRCDVQGRGIQISIPGGEELGLSLAAFYWDSLVPMTIEASTARRYPISKGYVLSSLQRGAYGGTYPAVDHEFQIKGRLALGGAVERDVVRRMLELQLRLMRGAPRGSWRDPCALQPRGSIEYHVTRRSKDRRNKAIMFFVTGNIEFLEELWLYTAASKDRGWLASIIEEVESVAAHVERQVDRTGLLWSDVYYEDQVMKDGRETIAQAFAVHSFGLLSELEAWLGRTGRAAHWRELAARLAQALVAPLPAGYWDPDAGRFIDWVDRAGRAHDHLHLLATELPLLFGLASPGQAERCRALLAGNAGVFQKFPSFVAARIEDYGPDEIGSGGPYDLCAAGRYWCWDAAFWSALHDGATLRAQLDAVAAQARTDRWRMGERYDMNYVYYKSDRNWHGAAHYYEYPNVFARVLLVEYLGLRPSLDADLHFRPLAGGPAEVRLETEGLAWAYRIDDGGLELANLVARDRSVVMELSGLWPQASEIAVGEHRFRQGETLTIGAGEVLRFRPVP